MNTLFLRLTAMFSLFVSLHVTAQNVYIPDANFRAFLQTTYPSCMSGNDLITNCNAVTGETFMSVTNRNIVDLTGIEYFTSLTTLLCYENQLTSLPPLPVTVTDLSCGNNQLTSLPSLPPSLTSLVCFYNQLTSLPALPNSLCNLQASGNDITCLPNLPTCSTFTSDIGTNICTATDNTHTTEASVISAYPNPSNNSFFIQLPQALEEGSTLSIYDLNGKLCESLQELKNGETLEIGRLFQPGFYVAELETGQGKNGVRLIKQ